AGPHPHRIARIEQRREEGQPRQMVEMGVGEIDVYVERRLARQVQPQGADAGAGVEDQPPPARSDLEARGIAAIAGIFRSGAGYRAAHAPEADLQTLGQSVSSNIPV